MRSLISILNSLAILCCLQAHPKHWILLLGLPANIHRIRGYATPKIHRALSPRLCPGRSSQRTIFCCWGRGVPGNMCLWANESVRLRTEDSRLQGFKASRPVEALAAGFLGNRLVAREIQTRPGICRSGGVLHGGRISHQRVLKRIGAGGMSVAYRARDDKLNRDVALKIPRTKKGAGRAISNPSPRAVWPDALL